MTRSLFSAKRFFSPPAVSPPFQLGRKQIYILPTAHGVVFMAVLAGMLLGSANYNNNLGFLLTFLLGGMAFVSIFHTYRNLAGLKILSVVSKPVFAGETAVFEFQVDAGRFDRAGVNLRIADGPETGPILLNGKTFRIHASAPAPARGILHPSPLCISTCHPLGLFRAWTRLSPPLTAIVYPKPIEGPMASRRPHPSDNGGHGRSASQGTDDFDALRAYRPGDSLRHISWKAFSKGQGVLTKTFTADTGQAITLDWQQLSGDDEKRLSRLCAMVLSAEQRGLRYGLALPGKNLDPGRGAPHKHRCLHALALFGTNSFKPGTPS